MLYPLSYEGGEVDGPVDGAASGPIAGGEPIAAHGTTPILRGMRLLFFHGAGGFDEDRGLAEGLGSALRASVDYPRLPDQDMSYAAWSATVGAGLGRVERGDVIVGHSFGASILLKVLAQEQSPLRAAVLLAMPDWSPSGWGVPDYQFEGPEPASSISLHHCTDDDVVPFAHLALPGRRSPVRRAHRDPRRQHHRAGVSTARSGPPVSVRTTPRHWLTWHREPTSRRPGPTRRRDL